ncbi:MAG: hypothetical protein KAW09_05875, partial [Thermoplasmata archaeon]|nr:hypothetical protein [Thermoplasmata archaeon]
PVDNASWNPWELFADDLTGPWSWDFDFPYVVGFYELYSLAEDNAGNNESKSQTAEALVAFTDRVGPPSNTSVGLTGSNLEDVTITWDLSPDDGGGNFMVIGYYVFKGPVFEPTGGLSYPTWDFVPPGVTSYVDIKAGEGDANSYYYNICASDPHDFISCDYVQVSKQTRSLSKGVNLISFPLLVPDESIRTVLQTVQFDKAWTYDSATGEWKHYTAFKPYIGELTSVDRTMGAWVDVTSDCNFTVAGIVPMNTTIQLNAGWNLIGFPSFDLTYTVSDLKAAVSSSRVEGYDPLAPYHLRVLGDVEVLQAGYGYWVWVDTATSYVLNA